MRIRYHLYVLFLLVMALVFGGCVAEDEAPPEVRAAAPAEFNADYAITGYVANGGKVETLTFRAVVSPDLDSTSSPLTTKEVTFDPQTGQSVASSLSDLARLAISECGAHALPPRGTIQPGEASRTCLASSYVSGQPYRRWQSAVNAGWPSALGGDETGGFAWSGTAEPSCGGLNASPQPFLFFPYEPLTAAQVLQYGPPRAG